jgi:hypothetical protein
MAINLLEQALASWIASSSALRLDSEQSVATSNLSIRFIGHTWASISFSSCLNYTSHQSKLASRYKSPEQ